MNGIASASLDFSCSDKRSVVQAWHRMLMQVYVSWPSVVEADPNVSTYMAYPGFSQAPEGAALAQTQVRDSPTPHCQLQVTQKRPPVKPCTVSHAKPPRV